MHCFTFMLLLQFLFSINLQVDHLTRRQEESERALQERILKLEGHRIQLEEVLKINHETKCYVRALKSLVLFSITEILLSL